MKIHIVKQSNGTIKCGFTNNQKIGPEVIYFTPENIAMLRSLLDTIEKASVAEFILEM